MESSGFLKLRKEKAEFQVNFIAPLQYGRISWPFIDRDLRNSAMQVQQTAIQLLLIPITDLPFHMAPLQAPLVTCSRVASLRTVSCSSAFCPGKDDIGRNYQTFSGKRYGNFVSIFLVCIFF